MLEELSLDPPDELLEPNVLVKPVLPLESPVAVTGVVVEDVVVEDVGEAVVEVDVDVVVEVDVDVEVDVGSSTSLTHSPARPPPAASA